MVTQEDCVCLSILILYLSWWAHEEIMIAFILCFWIYPRSMTLLSDCSLLAHMTVVSILIQIFGWDDQSLYFLVPNIY